MPNLFRHPTGHSRMHDVHVAPWVPKQVQHDIIFQTLSVLKPIAIITIG
ncbi:MAG: hypothetical protein JWR09_2650 [Mucilaginibacter sp.]|nr:hypothetical protein [Mucilaginibacter sp.]